MPRVIHFEIPADDLDRAQKFWLAYAADPEGNLFGVMQSDEAAH